MKIDLKPNQAIIIIGEDGIKTEHFFLKTFPEEQARALVEIVNGTVDLIHYAPELVRRMGGIYCDSDLDEEIDFEPDPQLVRLVKEKQENKNVIDFSKILTSRRKH